MRNLCQKYIVVCQILCTDDNNAFKKNVLKYMYNANSETKVLSLSFVICNVHLFIQFILHVHVHVQEYKFTTNYTIHTMVLWLLPVAVYTYS